MLLLNICSVTFAAEHNWQLVQETYVVQPGDTLNSIAGEFIQKNTYGIREIEEFVEGIRELNDIKKDENIYVGEELKINYWVKGVCK